MKWSDVCRCFIILLLHFAKVFDLLRFLFVIAAVLGFAPSASWASTNPSDSALSAPVLRQGMSSPWVRDLQVRLRHAKVLAVYYVDGVFGGQTREAVRKFQKAQGLPGSGVVDQATWIMLHQHSRTPTQAELDNLDIGPWFTAPGDPAFVKELQHRLRQVRQYAGPIHGAFDEATRQAVSDWRVHISLPASEVMDERAWTRLIGRTHNPRYAELFDAPPANTLAHQLDARCTQGKVVCISKQQRLISFVVDGQVQLTREARFSMPGWDSPEGEFRIWYKSSDTVSKIFGERFPMPYAFFYHGNVAVHFSQNFVDEGYEGGSHGCSQLRDYQSAKWLYEQVRVGDKVVVY